MITKNIKENLVQLCDIRAEISELESKLEKIEKEGIKVASAQASYKRPPFTKHDIIIEAQSLETRQKISYYKSVLQQRYDKLLQIQTETEEFISNLPTSRLRRIFELRYIDQCTWRKIAFVIGKGKNATEESVRKEHDRFFKEN